ncbi:cytochrome c1 [Dongia sedimenti]|uniref:Cytochrome c1 n=1 Tax=Dongia sedimenti TaxID=3064282 RepID=A0ABU0YSX7_9PROT|nr:cytochrome c1 [Rhodospirillaceae bacterium R-7]
MKKRSILLNGMALVTAVVAVLFIAAAPHEEVDIPKETWSFQGFFGKFDQAQVKRGFQVYKDVCSACHAMNLMSYRNLAQIGFSEDEIKEIAASVQVTDGPNDAGDMFERAGKPSDTFKPPFANEQAARAANNGALPPDLSLIARSRAGKGFAGYEGADYIHAILTGYKEPPAGFQLQDGMNYNEYFRGHQIAMPQPLSDGAVTFADGAPNTLEDESRDVAAFLSWAGEPNLEARHLTGLKAVLFLVVFTLLFYAVKRKVWSKIH